ncbi:MAG: hypothetical protein RR834_12275 [Thermomonas sp.]
MQRKSLITALIAGLGLAGAIAYAANRGAIAPVFATPAPAATTPIFEAGAPAGFSALVTDPVRTAARPVAPPTDAQVGEASSFGRNVRWLGMSAGPPALVSNDCAAVHRDDPSIQCQQVNDYAVDTAFAFSDLGRIELPASAANSMLCHWLTPFMQGQYYTTSASLTVGRIAYAPNITIESPVLADPAMINLQTGAPFNGRIERGASYEIEQAVLQQGLPTQVAFRQRSVTCADALVSKQQLIDVYGLTRSQADRFFASPVTLRFGVRGSVRNVGRVVFRMGARIVGD